jgi:hypothetical protein
MDFKLNFSELYKQPQQEVYDDGYAKGHEDGYNEGYEAGLKVAAEKYPTYEGDYVVTPSVDAQSLETAQKSLENDLTIKAIPYYETSNQKGGETVYIGKEVM